MAAPAEPFVVGGLSACLASSIVHPVDLAKVRLQLFKTQFPGKPIPSFPTIIGTMVKNEGIKSVYAGLSAALLRQCVYGTARIGLFKSFSEYLVKENEGKPLSFGLKALSGMGSGAIAVCLGTPCDVALVRMQADSMKPVESRRGYKNVFDALFRVFKEEGFVKLYSGLTPNVLRGMAMNAGQLACFDQAKEFIGQNIMNEDPKKTPSLNTQLGASLIAGFTASFVSLPFDLLKSRMQDANRYKNVVDAFVKVYQAEGILAFWTGFGAFYMRTAPHAMILLMSQQPIKEWYRKQTGQNSK